MDKTLLLNQVHVYFYKVINRFFFFNLRTRTNYFNLNLKDYLMLRFPSLQLTKEESSKVSKGQPA